MINDAADIKRTRSILELLPPGTKVVGAGKDRWRCACPIHGGGAGRFVIARQPGGWSFHCFACGAKGTVIDFVMLTKGVDFKTALRELGGGRGDMSRTEYFDNLEPPPAFVREGYTVFCDTRGCRASVDVEGGGEKGSDLLALLCAVDHLRALGWLVDVESENRARCPKCADILRAVHRRPQGAPRRAA